MLATHSVTTVSILDESEIYRLARDGHTIDIQPTLKSEAVLDLSEGLATTRGPFSQRSSPKPCWTCRKVLPQSIRDYG